MLNRETIKFWLVNPEWVAGNEERTMIECSVQYSKHRFVDEIEAREFFIDHCWDRIEEGNAAYLVRLDQEKGGWVGPTDYLGSTEKIGGA